MSAAIAWYSCAELDHPTTGLDKLIALAPRLILDQGDTPYIDGATDNRYGFGTLAGASASLSESDILSKYQQQWAHPAFARLQAYRAASGAQLFKQWDDHELLQDWDGSRSQAESVSASFSTQALTNAHFVKCSNALEAMRVGGYFDNPAPADGNTDRPSACTDEGQNPSAASYPIRYFSRDYSIAMEAGGSDVRVITLDCMSYRSPKAATDDASKRMLGAQQESWLLDMISDAAGFSHVFINSTKKWFRAATSDNGDTFGNYTTERDRLAAAIQATGVKVKILSGDKHRPHVMQSSVANGHLADLVDMCACSLSEQQNELQGGVVGADLIWKGYDFCFGAVHFDARAQAVVSIRSATTGSVMWQASFAPRSNTPIYADSATVTRLT